MKLFFFQYFLIKLALRRCFFLFFFQETLNLALSHSPPAFEYLKFSFSQMSNVFFYGFMRDLTMSGMKKKCGHNS